SKDGSKARETVGRRGATHCGGSVGLRRCKTGGGECRPDAALHRSAGAAADRFGERAGACALPAAVLAARQLLTGPARPRRLGAQEPAPAVRVLGARGLAAAARHLSAAALAHAA